MMEGRDLGAPLQGERRERGGSDMPHNTSQKGISVSWWSLLPSCP